MTVRLELPDDARDDFLAILLAARAELLGEIRRLGVDASVYRDRRGDKTLPQLDQVQRRHDLLTALIEQVRARD